MRRVAWFLLVIEPVFELGIAWWRWRRVRHPGEHWWGGLWAWLIYGHEHGTKGEWVPAIR